MSKQDKNSQFSKEELKMIQLIRERAKQDFGFRELFLSNPDEALRQFSKFEKNSKSE